MKKYIAEALGTFTLALVVALSIGAHFPIATPFLAAITLGLFVYSIGHISGSHINPAVTIGLWSIGKIKSADAINYIIAQVIGAVAALFLASYFVNVGNLAGTHISNALVVGFAELLGTFFFAFGIASVVLERAPGNSSGFIVGGSLFLGIVIAALLGSNGVLNPAVALGIGSFGIMYVVGPIVGSVLGMQVYKYLA
jgi:aquaporin Z